MERIAKFEKVSFAQFLKDWIDTFKFYMGNDSINKVEEVQEIYDSIQLPKRATKGSAGHDFHSPLAFTLKPNETIKIPTGIRVKMREDYVLMCFPRSSLGFKYRLQLDNTVPIIDSDYYNSDNEGHIFIKITNDSKEGKTLFVAQGMAFVQGIFVPFGVTEDDNVEEVRNGGFGSTNKEYSCI